MNKQLDLFLTLTASTASIKSNRDLMTHNWTDLSKAHKRKLIEHKTADGSWVKIHGHEDHGMATIYDMDVLLFITSLLMEKVNKGEQLSPKLKFSGYEYFHFTDKSKSGKTDKELQNALTRLHTTRIETSIRSEDKKELYSSFYWLSEWDKVIENRRVTGYSVTLPNWIFESITTPNLVLTLDAEYFQIAGGLTRWMYLYCRKAQGPQKKNKVWREGFDSIFQKSGMKSKKKEFNRKLREIISSQAIPNYYLEENEREVLTITRTRTSLRPPKEMPKKLNAPPIENWKKTTDIFRKMSGSLFK